MTGARVNEIAQLLLSDVLADDGVYYLNLESDNESGKKLKNANARRKIPLHSKLISLGFIDYVNALKDAGYAVSSRSLNHIKQKAMVGQFPHGSMNRCLRGG
jgi:hypothetical protein